MLDFDDLEIQEQSHQETLSNIVTRSLEERLSEISFNCTAYDFQKVFGPKFVQFAELKYNRNTNFVTPVINVYTSELHSVDTTYALRQEFYNFYISWLFDSYPDFIKTADINGIIHPEYMGRIPFNIDIHHVCHSSIQFYQKSFSKIYKKLDMMLKFLKDRDGSHIKLTLFLPPVFYDKMTEKEIVRHMSRVYQFVEYGMNHKKWKHVIDSINIDTRNMDMFLDAYIRTGKCRVPAGEMDYFRNYTLCDAVALPIEDTYYFLWRCITAFPHLVLLNSETEDQ